MKLNVLIVGHDIAKRLLIEGSITRHYPEARVYYSEEGKYLNTLLQQLNIDIVIVPALSWDRTLFRLDGMAILPQLILTTTPRARGIDSFSQLYPHVLQEPFMDWRVHTCMHNVLKTGATKMSDWDFLLLNYNSRLTIIPFNEIKCVEEDAPFLTIKTDKNVYVLSSKNQPVSSKILPRFFSHIVRKE